MSDNPIDPKRKEGTQKMIIRRADGNDIPSIDRLLFQVHKVHADKRPDLFRPGCKKYDDEQLSILLKDDTRPVFLAEEGEKVLGYAFCILTNETNPSHMPIKTLYIDDLCVDETVRGQKVGSALFSYVSDYARKEGCHNLTLNVWACNEGAMRFYEKCGLKVQKYGMEVIF